MANKTWTQSEFETLILRIEAIENALNDMQTAVNNVATKGQMKALLTLRQNEIDDLQSRVESLEAQIKVLQGFHT